MFIPQEHPKLGHQKPNRCLLGRRNCGKIIVDDFLQDIYSLKVNNNSRRSKHNCDLFFILSEGVTLVVVRSYFFLRLDCLDNCPLGLDVAA